MPEIDFSNLHDAAIKLEKKRFEERCTIACRAALRACPNLLFHGPISEDQVLLTAFRALLTSAVAGIGQLANQSFGAGNDHSVHVAAMASAKTHIEDKTSSQYSAAVSAADSVNFTRHTKEVSTALWCAEAVHTAAESVGLAADLAAANAAGSGAGERREAARSSARQAVLVAAKSDFENSGIAPFLEPLWGARRVAFTANQNHLKFVEHLASSNGSWRFWHDWYLGMWEGTFDDWDLATEVAKIPDDVWQEGAEAVAEEIERRRTRLNLEREVAELKEALRQSTEPRADLPPRTHNSPPPEQIIDEQQPINREIVLIWEQIETLEEEIEKPEPSVKSLKTIAETLWEISVRIAAYLGSLTDVALKESAKTVGGTGIKTAIGVLTTTTAAQNEGVRSVVKAIWEFVKTLPPG